MSMNLTLTMPNKNRIDLFQLNTLETNRVLAESTTAARVEKYLYIVQHNFVRAWRLPTNERIVEWFRNNPYKGTPEFIEDMRILGLPWEAFKPAVERFDSLQQYYTTEQRVLHAVAEGAVFSKR